MSTRTSLTLLWTGIASYAAGFSALSILRHESFATGRFDLGNMTQAVWSTAQGHPLAVTDLHGSQVSRLSSHVDPILILLAPLWRLWPSPSMLLTMQAGAVALGALPVFWLARLRLSSYRAALGFALTYLLLPAVQWLTLNEFHPVALACPLLLYAFWFLHQDRLLPFAIFAIGAAASKEEIPLVLAGYGVWYGATRQRRLVGAAITVTGISLSVLALAVVIPHFNHGSGSSFYLRYNEVGGSPGGIARTALTYPNELLQTALDERGVRYLADLLLPLAGLPLAAPLLLLAAMPELLLNLLSSAKTQTSIHYHYAAGAIPPLLVGAILGASRLARARQTSVARLGGAVVLVALAANIHLGAIPLWRQIPLGNHYGAYVPSISEHDRQAARALRLIPSDAVVSASNSLGAHLSARQRILSFPTLADAIWVAVDENEGSYADRIAPLPATRELIRLRRNPSFRLVFQEDGILIFRRRTRDSERNRQRKQATRPWPHPYEKHALRGVKQFLDDLHPLHNLLDAPVWGRVADDRILGYLLRSGLSTIHLFPTTQTA